MKFIRRNTLSSNRIVRFIPGLEADQAIMRHRRYSRDIAHYPPATIHISYRENRLLGLFQQCEVSLLPLLTSRSHLQRVYFWTTLIDAHQMNMSKPYLIISFLS